MWRLLEPGRFVGGTLGVLFALAWAPCVDAATAVYYSVGISRATSTDLKWGSPTITIVGGVATFSEAQPSNVGVGDEVSYGGGPTLVYISGRLSSTRYTVTDRLGVPAADVTGATVNRIYRAFADLITAEASSTNGTHLGTANLVTGNFQLNWPCYADGPIVMNDGQEVDIAGYTTGPTNYIRVYTPTSSSEVGASQRHRGVFGTGFRLEGTNADTIQIDDDYVRIEGLTILATVSNNDATWGGIWSIPNGTSDVRISHNIIKGNVTDAAGRRAYGMIVGDGSADVNRVWNNVVFNFPVTSGDFGFGIGLGAGTAYVFNNTVYNCDTGIWDNSPSAGHVVKNNVSINYALDTTHPFVDYYQLAGTTRSSNVSSDATSETVSLQNKTAYASYFVNTIAGDEDLRLRNTSLTLWGSNGADLSADASLPVTDDVDGVSRVRPDIGADEFGWTPGAHMLVKSGRYTGNGSAGRAIDVGFQPDAVLVKRIAAAGDTYAVLRTATMTGDNTKDLDNAGLALVGGLVQSLSATGFTIGSDPRVNANAVDYAWVAFKAAAGEMKVDKYLGSGSATQSVPGVGFRPDYLIVMPETGAAAGVPVSVASTLPADTSFDFDATQAGPNCIRALEPDGFQVGDGSGSTNCGNLTSGSATFHYVAWNAAPGRMTAGTYTGDGTAARNLDVAGFFPEWVIVKKYPDGSTQRPAIHKPASTGSSTNLGLRFVDSGTLINTIRALRRLGFQVGSDERVNSATACSGACTYHWVAFGPHLPPVNHRSIGDTTTSYGTVGTTGVGTTVSVTADSATVTGVGGTTWNAANRGRGDVITIPCPDAGCTGGVSYQVLAVVSDTTLTLASPYTGSAGAQSYRIRRQFASPQAWEDCIDGQGGTAPPNAPCYYFPAPTSSLVTDDRSEVGIVYEDVAFTGVLDGYLLQINGSTTDAAHSITLTADGQNRHYGIAGTGVRLQIAAGSTSGEVIQVADPWVTFEWMEVTGESGLAVEADGIEVEGGGAGTVTLRNNLIHHVGAGIQLQDAAADYDVYNNFVYSTVKEGIGVSPTGAWTGSARIFNNTVFAAGQEGFYSNTSPNPTVVLRNNVARSNTDGDYAIASASSSSSNNISGDASAPGAGSFTGVCLSGAGCLNFVSSTDLHLQGTSFAIDKGVNLGSTFLADIDGAYRVGTWDVGADELNGTTAVRLMSFSAVAGDGSVTLEWRTGSELDNLGFHLHRGLSADGPWTRLTSSLIAGLGSSPLGRAYAWLDTGLTNGQRYYYRLEDVDTASKSTFHGPISAVPVPEPSAPGEDGDGDGGGDGTEHGGSEPGSTSCPSWVLAAAPDVLSPTCTKHGDPDSVSLQVLARDPSSATLELHTGGFWALRDVAGEVRGEARVFVPGLEFPSDPRAPALPLRRALVEAVVGRGVQLVSAEAYEERTFGGLRPGAVGAAEVFVGRDGTVRPARRSVGVRLVSRGYQPRELARLSGTVFQGERKRAVVEIFPVRFSGGVGELVLAGRVRVRLAFGGVAEGESGTGSRGRAVPRKSSPLRDVLAQMHTSTRGLHAVSYEALFPQRSRGFSTAFLRLQRQGEAVAFHVEPAGPVFGAGSVLYFFADRTASSTEYSSEVSYELVRSREATPMAVSAGPPEGAGLTSSSTGFASFETNRIYQPGLLDAADVWLWDGMGSGVVRVKPFVLRGVATGSEQPARVGVDLQGGSDAVETLADHHVSVNVNGVDVGEAFFDGKRPYRLRATVPASLLREGTNELAVVNVGDTGVNSLVFLDRFEVSYPQVSAVRGGVFEGEWGESGTVEVGGLSGPPVILRDSGLPGLEGSAVRWLTGFQTSGGSVRFRAEAGHRYLVVSPDGLLSPRIGRMPLSTLRDGANQADHLVIAPREFLAAAGPLLERRRSQGLSSRGVSLEAIASEFGHGQPSAEAIRSFLAYAYHSWWRPSPRYVLLLGDATYDPRRFVSTSWASPLPALWARTSYLWTVSDPALGAVNGEDLVPDLAIGRLPATTAGEAERLVGKLLDWEDRGEGIGGDAVLVADDPDAGGDFEANAEDIRASFLESRATTTLKVGELGAGTRAAILAAFDEGASLMSYVGHGGTAVWASENVLSSWDVAALRAQGGQPVLLTMNCLNGYFVAPNLDALPEALLKAEGRGVVAAFSPSGLSLDGPAHQYHRAVVAELVTGEHERLGDAILAAQATYAQAGLMPELLTVYQLLGDPATRIR